MSIRLNNQDNFVYNNLSNSVEPNNYTNNQNDSETISSNSGSNINLSQNNPINKGEFISHSNICWLFLITSFLCVLFLLLNLIFTIDAFSDNRVIIMNAEKICNALIVEHNECLNKFRKTSSPEETISECLSQSLNLQYCYDQVYYYNKKCYIYLSEFDKCVRDNKKINDSMDYLKMRCRVSIDGIERCTGDYMTIDPFILIIDSS